MRIDKFPMVTVFTLVYNTGKYVVEALESVKANNYPNVQHIIIDDYSFDGESVAIVEAWINENDYPCTFIKHEKNYGVCKTLNEVLALANGDYLIGVSDDILTNTRIHDHVQKFEESDESVAVVVSDSVIVNYKQDVLHASFINYYKNKPVKDVDFRDIFLELIYGNFLPAMSSTMRVKAVRDIGGFDETLPYEDWDLWLRLSAQYSFVYCDRIGSYYRMHENNLHKVIPNYFYFSVKILSKHMNDNRVVGVLRQSLAKYYELGYRTEALQILQEFRIRSHKSGLLGFFIKSRLPFNLYRPIKFLNKLVS